MISKKKFGTTVTAFGVAAGMLLGSAAPAHAEETAKTVQETQKDQADAPATQSETENGNTEEAVVPAVETQETETPAEEPSVPSQDEMPLHRGARSTGNARTDRGSDSNGDTGRPESRRDAGAIPK